MRVVVFSWVQKIVGRIGQAILPPSLLPSQGDPLFGRILRDQFLKFTEILPEIRQVTNRVGTVRRTGSHFRRCRDALGVELSVIEIGVPHIGDD